jgi:hypothetical protein
LIPGVVFGCQATAFDRSIDNLSTIFDASSDLTLTAPIAFAVFATSDIAMQSEPALFVMPLFDIALLS